MPSNSEPAASPSMATVHNTFGVLYDAVVVSGVLYGAAVIQEWIYYQKYWRKDPPMNKLLVVLVLMTDTCQVVLLTESIYVYLVTGHLDPLAFSRTVKTLPVAIFPGAIIALLVRNFSAYRTYRLSKGNWILAASITVPSLAVFASTLFYATTALGYQDIAEFENIQKVSLAIAILGAVVDSLISVIIIHLLLSHKGHSDNRRTTDLLNFLIIFTFSTGVPTSLAAIASAISLAVAPHTMVYIFWFTLLGSLYTNSLMVTLNSRGYIRSRGSDEAIQVQSTLRFRPVTEIISGTRSGLPNSHHIAIRIHEQTEIDLELGRYPSESSESK
ncbi:hypothetical protein B0H17DRAFT_1061650 [Mycena rosella]|uniref:DUF6534 domain-containing protein n=1 Tax=Mycena rosella TaxID=1033263 RepID=A0AAD7GKK7_MYCRO|nr:hypothetical protein B0H17DRAFT_1061650 [Mycena rosella]